MIQCSDVKWYRIKIQQMLILLGMFWGFQSIAQSNEMYGNIVGQDTAPAANISQRNVGEFTGNARYVAMSTRQFHQQMNAHAQAISLMLKYTSPVYKHFQTGISGAWIQSLYTSDLGFQDPVTGARNRYEIGLFDQAHYRYKPSLFRAEELYIRYTSHAFSVITGRYALDIPFINEQDGRMRPTLVQGVSAVGNLHSKWKMDAGWLNAVLPRGTMHWMHFPASTGVYAAGKARTGLGLSNTDSFTSSGVLYASLQFQPTTNFQAEALSQTFAGVMHHSYLQVRWGNIEADSGKFMLAMRVIRQDAIHSADAVDHVSRFIESGQNAWILSSRIARRWKRHLFMLNHTRITVQGKFLMPREWGREPFYTFIPRERLEGAGNVHAISFVYENRPMSKHWFVSLAISSVKMPSVYDTRLNTYGIGSYLHSKCEVGMYPIPKKQNWELRLLLIHKYPLGPQIPQIQHMVNKVRLLHLTITLNYTFTQPLKS